MKTYWKIKIDMGSDHTPWILFENVTVGNDVIVPGANELALSVNTTTKELQFSRWFGSTNFTTDILTMDFSTAATVVYSNYTIVGNMVHMFCRFYPTTNVDTQWQIATAPFPIRGDWIGWVCGSVIVSESIRFPIYGTIFWGNMVIMRVDWLAFPLNSTVDLVYTYLGNI